MQSDTYYRPQFVTSLVFTKTGDVITGDSSGLVMIWFRSVDDVYTASKTTSPDLRTAHKVGVKVKVKAKVGVRVGGCIIVQC